MHPWAVLIKVWPYMSTISSSVVWEVVGIVGNLFLGARFLLRLALGLLPFTSPRGRFLGKFQFLGVHCLNNPITKGRGYQCVSLDHLCLYQDGSMRTQPYSHPPLCLVNIGDLMTRSLGVDFSSQHRCLAGQLGNLLDVSMIWTFGRWRLLAGKNQAKPFEPLGLIPKVRHSWRLVANTNYPAAAQVCGFLSRDWGLSVL